MKDAHKRLVHGYRGKGKTCPCCRETSTKKEATRLARRRLKAADKKALRGGQE